MSFDAKVLEVIIASPSDVARERNIVEEVIANWNSAHAEKEQIVLLVRRWERDSSTELSGRPQQMINDHVLANSDILIGIFHTRIGTPTSEHESGTVEEIKLHHEAGRPVMLYFSEKAIPPNRVDTDQYAKIKEFQTWARDKGIYDSFRSSADFKSKLTTKLPHTLNRNSYIRSLTKIDFLVASSAVSAETPAPAAVAAHIEGLTVDAQGLLQKAAASDKGEILRHPGSGGPFFVPGQQFKTDPSPRETARWEEVMKELIANGFVRDSNGKGIIFRVTSDGYEEADRLFIR
jgi:hypothetical protein